MRKKYNLLVVDDDKAHRTMLSTLLRGWGYDVTEADDGSTAIERVHENPFDVILMDIRMLRVSGIEALEKIKSYNPAIPIIIMTAYSSVETAVETLKKGAYDYLTKPLDFDKLRITLEKAMEHTRLKEENRVLRENAGQHFNKHKIIGSSQAMIKLFEIVEQVAPSEATILIHGESGTGKELIAGAIHYNSHRKNNVFVKINCAAITETLLESELFGYEKGAFTGANKQKQGKFLQANNGSLLLDEVSEMSLAMQVKLLRVLQEREITRVGGDKVIPVDVRVIAATNKNLTELTKKGAFREDLFYRLNVVMLEVPALRNRGDDIPLLATHFLDIFSKKNQKKIKGFTPAAMDCFIKYVWPGNVRELMNTIERGVVLARSDYIDADDLPMLQRQHLQEGMVPIQYRDEHESLLTESISLDEVEKATIMQTLHATDGNKSEAARRLGITRKTLHKKLKKYGVMP
jgi:two-component system response regulator HydG